MSAGSKQLTNEGSDRITTFLPGVPKFTAAPTVPVDIIRWKLERESFSRALDAESPDNVEVGDPLGAGACLRESESTISMQGVVY